MSKGKGILLLLGLGAGAAILAESKPAKAKAPATKGPLSPTKPVAPVPIPKAPAVVSNPADNLPESPIPSGINTTSPQMPGVTFDVPGQDTPFIGLDPSQISGGTNPAPTTDNIKLDQPEEPSLLDQLSNAAGESTGGSWL